MRPNPEESRGLARIGILVISDRASRGEYDDKSGKAINEFLNKTIRSNWIAIVKIVPGWRGQRRRRRSSKCRTTKTATWC